MPNHVTHKFTVEGESPELQRFMDKCFIDGEHGKEFDFNTLIPRPEILDKTISGNTPEMDTDEYKAIEAEAIKQTGCSNWYEWSNKYWNTKWNAYHTYIHQTDEIVIFEFDTAWSCPVPVFEKLAKEFPTLSFTGYALDEGYCFGAEILIEEGESNVEFLEVNAGLMEAF